MKNLLATTAFAALCWALPAQAEGVHNCGDAVTCNNGTINKDNISQDIVSTDNVYAPDSATANASVGDVIAQGGTGGNANAHGNTSTNHNNSNANIGANSQTNGNISNDVMGGNLTQGAITGGGNHQGDITGGSAAGGNVHGGNNTTSLNGGAATTISGPATTNSGNVQGGSVGDTTALGGTSTVAGSGNSANRNTAVGGSQGQQQGQRQSSASVSSAAGGNSRNTVATKQGNVQQTNIDASQRTTIRHAANTAYAASLGGYGPGNCFGDTNPSGSFSAGMQGLLFGATAASQKASNVCAIYAVGGADAAAAYLAAMDPNAHRALVAAGVVTTPSRVKAAEVQRSSNRATTAAYSKCEMLNGRLHVTVRRGQDRATAVEQCKAVMGQSSSYAEAAPAAVAIPTCPQGSTWDGRGCWMPNRR